MTYLLGEDFDKEGIKVTAVYNDGSKEDITEEVVIEGYNKEKLGEQELTVKYEEKVATFKITVIEKEKVIIEAPIKTTYKVGEKLDLVGGTITITYPNKKAEKLALNNSEVMVLGYNKDQEGEQELTVKYKEYTGTFKVFVIAEKEEKAFKLGTIEIKRFQEEEYIYVDSKIDTVSALSKEIKNGN